MSQPLLQVTGLKRHFDGVRAVDGVDLHVDEHQVVSIIGPNGSGKTTTLNLITGVIRPQAGTVKLRNALAAARPERMARQGVFRTFQNGRVFGNLSVDDNIAVGAHTGLRWLRPFKRWDGHPLLGWLPSLAAVAVALLPTRHARWEDKELGERIAGQVGRFDQRLGSRRDHLAYTLSYANRRRTELARCLIAGPELLVLDEPTAGMNQSETAEMLEQLLELKESGQAMLLVEHKLDLVMTLSDYVYVMDSGVVIAEGTPAEVRHNPLVIDAYLGRHA